MEDTYFQSAFFEIFIFIYCRCKFIVAKIVKPHIHCSETGSIFPCIPINVYHIKKVLNESCKP